MNCKTVNDNCFKLNKTNMLSDKISIEFMNEQILCPSVDTSRAVQRSISHFRTQTPCSMSRFSKRTEREDFFERLTRFQNPHSGSLCCYLYSILTLNLTLKEKRIKWNDLAPCWSNCHGGVDQTGGVYKGGASNARLKGQKKRLFDRGRLLDHLRYWTGGTSKPLSTSKWPKNNTDHNN